MADKKFSIRNIKLNEFHDLLLNQENIEKFIKEIYYDVIQKNRLDIMKMLIDEFNFDVARDDNQPIRYCGNNTFCDIFDMIILLTNHGADISYLFKRMNGNLLVASNICKYLSLEHLKSMVDHGLDINMHNGAIINTYCNSNKYDHVKFLLESGINKDHLGDEALINAINIGNIDIVKLLLEYNADVNSRSGLPLKTAIQRFHTDVVELLLENGADTNLFNQFKAKKEVNYMTSLLISKGIDPMCLAEFMMYLYDGVDPDYD
ncbi:MAG: hypothetical protein Satyrvirus4_6 [Satyrvirus sp.]|uniref:Uncharacterized protein n=1 Tax=Satyrvirus sp. TaxID=2487771 RepID=A0A3G5AI76_9VIRU|nr:MAG: hypothetical protein Satyrvirus4_6 [Satyrvirus sp.]